MQSKEVKNITKLHPVLLAKIISFLPLKDYSKTTRINREFYNASRNDISFERILSRLGFEFAFKQQRLAREHLLKIELFQLQDYFDLTTLEPEESLKTQKKIIAADLPDAKDLLAIFGDGGLKRALRGPIENQEILKKRNQSKLKEISVKILSLLFHYLDNFQLETNNALLFKAITTNSLQAIMLKTIKNLLDLNITTPAQMNLHNFNRAFEWFESFQISQFVKSFDLKDYEQMKSCSDALYFLNGAKSCVDVFILKNPVFFDPFLNPSLLGNKLPLPTGPSLGSRLADEYVGYINNLLDNCRQQQEFVHKVFAQEVSVMSVFTTKILKEFIKEYQTATINATKARESIPMYLHTLAVCVNCCFQFVNCMAEDMDATHKQLLVTLAIGLFEPFLKDYGVLEVGSLDTEYKAMIKAWNKENKSDSVGEKKDGVNSNSKEKKSAMSLKGIMNSLTSTKPLDVSQPLLEHLESEHIFEGPKEGTLISIKDDSLRALVSVDLTNALIERNKESLYRTLVIYAHLDIKKIRPNIQSIFIKLLKTLSDMHIKPAFQIAYQRLHKATPVDFPKGEKMINRDCLSFFDLVQKGDQIQSLLQTYYSADIKCWIDEQDFLSELIIEKKAFEAVLDDSVATGMDKTIQVVINQCEFILVSGQGMNDFNPPVSQKTYDVSVTRACRQVIQCLRDYEEVLKKSVEKQTMEIFFGEVSIRLFTLIVKNVRRLIVSQIGAMQLISDFNAYYEWAYSLRQVSSTKTFQALKELGNLFLADSSEELRSLVHDTPRFNGALRIEEIYEILQSRSDYREIRKQVEAKDCVIQ